MEQFVRTYVLLTRSQYDILLDNANDYFNGNFQKLEKKWLLGGVSVKGTPEQLQELVDVCAKHGIKK